MSPVLYLAQCQSYNLVLMELNPKLEQNDLSSCQPRVMCKASCCRGHTRDHLGCTPQTKVARVSAVNNSPMIPGCLRTDTLCSDRRTCMSKASFQTHTTVTRARQSPHSEHALGVAAVPLSTCSPSLCCVHCVQPLSPRIQRQTEVDSSPRELAVLPGEISSWNGD